MRNLILFAIAFQVILSESDVEELGYDVTEIDFRNYFGIPEDATFDEKKMSSNFAKSEEFKVKDLEYYMNGEEKKVTKNMEEENPVKKTKTTKKPLKQEKPVTQPKETAKDKKNRELLETMKKTLNDNGYSLVDGIFLKEGSEIKIYEEELKTLKLKELEGKINPKSKEKKPKSISRSQMIQVYFANGISVLQIIDAHPDWNKGHVGSAYYYASKNQDKVEISLGIFKDLELVLPTFRTDEEIKPKKVETTEEKPTETSVDVNVETKNQE